MVIASQLTANPKNWRTHSREQMEAVEETLSTIGFAGSVLARELPDGSLQLIDGHARAQASGDSPIPVAILDVTEQEADTLLATYDTIGSMAGADPYKLNDLLTSVSVQSQELNEILADLSFVPDIDKDSEDAEEILEEQSEKLKAFIAFRKRAQLRGQDKAEQNFYVAVVFQSWAQKQEFLKNLPTPTPTLYGMYVDGQTLAQTLNIPITPNALPPMHSHLDKKLAAMVEQQRAEALENFEDTDPVPGTEEEQE